MMDEKGLSLSETLVVLALFGLLIVPSMAMLGQSTRVYQRALSSYKAELLLDNILLNAKIAAQRNELDSYQLNLAKISGCEIFAETYECVVIAEDFNTDIKSFYYYPYNHGWELESAEISGRYFLNGLITAGVRDKLTGTIKIRTQVF
jgi:hypothetical protein